MNDKWTEANTKQAESRMIRRASFSKVLAKYYHGWFRDCWDSAVYCEQRGDFKKAEEYLKDMKQYLEIILDNYDAIEFFSIDSNAFKYDAFLPEEYRGYK